MSFLYTVRTKLHIKIKWHDDVYFISWLQESTEKQKKTSFLKETGENVYLHKALLKAH